MMRINLLHPRIPARNNRLVTKKTSLFFFVALGFCVLISPLSFAAEKYDRNSMDSLGGNRDLIRRARAMDPDNRVPVVQNRSVDRNLRLELGVNGGLVAGGDPYLNTQNIGGTADFHITPRWSVGVRFNKFFSQLNSEGEKVYNDAAARQAAGQTNVNGFQTSYPSTSTLGVVSFYPFYGKLNLFDMGVAQFDFYVLGGGGVVQLTNGSSPSYTGGAGVGLWFTQHFAGHIEARYQNYRDQIYTGSRNIDAFMMTVGIGFLL